MKNQEKTQTKESCNIAAIIMADRYMGFTIPFSKYRDAKVVLPKVFTPAEAETFKKAILPIIAESNDSNTVGNDYEEPCLIVHMFLSARNTKFIGTKRDIIHIPHSVKISEEKIAYTARIPMRHCWTSWLRWWPIISTRTGCTSTPVSVRRNAISTASRPWWPSNAPTRKTSSSTAISAISWQA